MKRNKIEPRNNWQNKVEELGFGFHTTNLPYWDESAYYSFSLNEIEEIERVTLELWDLCLEAVQFVIDEKLYDKFHIPGWMIPHIERSWHEDHPSIYGRFDFGYDGKNLKMFEFNADTPTSLFEAGIVQWYWLEDFDSSKDQFNSIHEKLAGTWEYLKPYFYDSPLYFTCVKRNLEDLTTVEYLRDCAIQGGFDTKLIMLDDIGWDENAKLFVDLDDNPIKNIFKLYPWEFMVNESFGKNIIEDKLKSLWIEPSWKMILSNKAILPILWGLNPKHPNLLKSEFDNFGMKNYVKKPILSREGANITIYRNDQVLDQTTGQYGTEGYVYQELFEIPNFDGNFPIIGSWVIGQEAGGIGIRENDSLITNNNSRFIPHLID